MAIGYSEQGSDRVQIPKKNYAKAPSPHPIPKTRELTCRANTNEQKKMVVKENLSMPDFHINLRNVIFRKTPIEIV